MESSKFIGGSIAIVDVDLIFGAMRVQPRAAGIFTEAQVPYDGLC